MGVAEPAVSAAKKDETVTRFCKVQQDGFLVFIQNLSSHRNTDHQIFSIGARAVAPHPMTTLLGTEVLGITEINESVQVIDAFNNNAATSSAIPTIWTAKFNKFLTPEATASGSAVSALDVDFGLIEKFHPL
jgi:hypothetical protein